MPAQDEIDAAVRAFWGAHPFPGLVLDGNEVERVLTFALGAAEYARNARRVSLTAEQAAEIDAKVLQEYRRAGLLSAIKMYHSETGSYLKEAKDSVEKLVHGSKT